MPNGILNQPHIKPNHTSTNNNIKPRRETKTKQQDNVAKNTNNQTNKNKSNVTTQQAQQQPNILNVAEMLLNGFADNEILTIWLQSISCQEFASNFLNAGYDMPTISRITPQDLTAIGITDPAKRLKILSEIKKLNLQDGIPNFKPANLNHWLSLLRLDSQYFKSLCDQQIDTIDKMCQLTWEDFEELGITKLGHQKRLLLAIERVKELGSQEAKAATKSISEPIYDSNPSQILLVASAENHSMNGPIINKQSSTSELSSTGSGSMHSVYSANSIHYQPTYATLPTIQQQLDQNQQQQTVNHMHHQQQIIYSKPPSQMSTPSHAKQSVQQKTAPLMPPPTFHQHNQSSHYQTSQPLASTPRFMNAIYGTNTSNKRNTMVPQTNHQMSNQLPFSALANLPKHQQQLLQQSSIYATLGRQPQRAKQPPPVPVRTNSLKSNSLVDDDMIRQQSQHSTANNQMTSQTLNSSQTNSASSLYRFGTRVSSKSQYNSQTLLTKNKSFSGNAFMESARARFLNRNSNYQPVLSTGSDHTPTLMNQIDAQNLTYGVNANFRPSNNINGFQTVDSDSMSIYSRQSFAGSGTVDRSNTFNMHPPAVQTLKPYHQQQRYSSPPTKLQSSGDIVSERSLTNGDDYDLNSDTTSTKSLTLTNEARLPSASSVRQTSLSQDSGSSQTIYNSASSGSNDRGINGCNLSQSGDSAPKYSAASNSTLNDVNMIQENIAVSNRPNNQWNACNATTGRDDDFPPPPSPLSLTDSDENDILSINSDNNFNNINKGLMAFRVGT